MVRKRVGELKTRYLISLMLLLLGLMAWILVDKEEAYRFFIEATGKKADLVVVATYDLGELKRPWAHLAQGGEDTKSNMFAQLSGKLALISPRTVRLDHIFDGYGVVSRGSNGQLVFDWRRLDEVVTSIRQAGAIPMFSLSYMPPAISSGDVIDVPRDWNEWALVVQRTIEHYSGELGIPDISYEVWNEPDLFGGWKTRGEKNYLELYRWSAIGAGRASVVQQFELGGPATTGAYPSWIDAFLGFVEENNLRVDFLSWHRYSKDVSDYSSDVSYVMGALTQYPNTLRKGVNLYITESGPSSELDEVYDDKHGAAHLMAMTRELIDDAHRVYSFEVVDGKDPNGAEYWGRWGILTHPDFGANEKPRYDALGILNKLSGKRLTVFGEGTWVKAIASITTNGIVQVMLVNYDEYGKHLETVPLTIEGLGVGDYKVRKELLGGGISEEEVAVGSSGKYQTSTIMPSSGVMLLEVEPGEG